MTFFPGFELATIDTGEATIRVRTGGSGPPLDYEPYSKRAFARDQVEVMRQLGFERFAVAGHDRGGRTAYRMALDHALAEYLRALRDAATVHAICEDYRAGATFDRELDARDRAEGRTIACPCSCSGASARTSIRWIRSVCGGGGPTTCGAEVWTAATSSLRSGLRRPCESSSPSSADRESLAAGCPTTDGCVPCCLVGQPETYSVRLGERGRLVLPAELRRRAGLREGEELLLIYADGVLRLATRAELAKAGRGMFSDLTPDRDLVAELIRQRRDDASSNDSDPEELPAGS